MNPNTDNECTEVMRFAGAVNDPARLLCQETCISYGHTIEETYQLHPECIECAEEDPYPTWQDLAASSGGAEAQRLCMLAARYGCTYTIQTDTVDVSSHRCPAPAPPPEDGLSCVCEYKPFLGVLAWGHRESVELGGGNVLLIILLLLLVFALRVRIRSKPADSLQHRTMKCSGSSDSCPSSSFCPGVRVVLAVPGRAGQLRQPVRRQPLPRLPDPGGAAPAGAASAGAGRGERSAAWGSKEAAEVGHG